MSDPTDDLADADKEALLRWRLALGPGAEKASAQFSLEALRSLAASFDVDPSRVGDLDQALSFVYEDQKASLGASRPYIPRWLASLREFFRHDVVALVQRDAIEKKGLTQLLFEPETLPFLEKNVELVATLLAARGLIPDRAREAARQIVREVVSEVRKKLEAELRTAVIGAVRRDRATSTGSAPSTRTSRAGTPRESACCRTGFTSGPTSGGATSGTWPSSSTSRARWRRAWSIARSWRRSSPRSTCCGPGSCSSTPRWST